jgi:hypothetical protein
MKQNPADRTPLELADIFCRHARRRVKQRFGQVFDNDDVATYRVATGVLEGRYEWLEKPLGAE